MLYRGYDNRGDRVKMKIHFSPTLFVSAHKDEGWRGLDGKIVAPIVFDSMFEANQWLRQNTDVGGQSIYGNKKFVQQFITEKYPRDIEFKREEKDEKDSKRRSWSEADLEGALSNDRLSDQEKELLKKEDEFFKKATRRRNTDNQLAHALDLIQGLSVYSDLIND